MTAIAASAVRCQTMADGTLRLVVDIEPRNAQAAFRMFASPGTPVALAALKTKAKAQQDDKPKGGAISQWLAMRCQEPEFQKWLLPIGAPEIGFRGSTMTPEHAASVVRQLCSVTSRAKIDHDADARERFERLIRGPWMGRNDQVKPGRSASA